MMDCGRPRLRQAISVLRAGGVIAYPTEAVWGLGCAYDNQHGVARILQLKSRSPKKGLILVAADINQFDFLLEDLDPQVCGPLRASWPGPTTWLVPHRNRLPDWISGEHNTVALRVSNHPTVQALCRGFGGPLVSTSANPQGARPARFGFQARRYFGESVFYVPGRVGASARPSQIRDLSTGAVIRA